MVELRSPVHCLKGVFRVFAQFESQVRVIGQQQHAAKYEAGEITPVLAQPSRICRHTLFLIPRKRIA
jgi:hypothetical protein